MVGRLSDRAGDVRFDGTVASPVNLRSPIVPAWGTGICRRRRRAWRSVRRTRRRLERPLQFREHFFGVHLPLRGALHGSKSLCPISLAPERCPTPARHTTPMVNNYGMNRSYRRQPLVLNNESKETPPGNMVVIAVAQTLDIPRRWSGHGDRHGANLARYRFVGSTEFAWNGPNPELAPFTQDGRCARPAIAPASSPTRT
jgi:hypothetical protein